MALPSLSSLLFLLSLALPLYPSAVSDIAADRTALLRFSSAVGGRTLAWNRSEPDPCSWNGVTCDAAAGRVVELRLPGHGLVGEIPSSSIGNLTGLRTLSLRRNSLSGALPPDMGLCTGLQFLFLQENGFSGEIPQSLYGLRNLTRIDVSFNNFSGQVSPELDRLTGLRALFLQNNRLTGSLPELNSLSGLREFNVSFNIVNGSIPSRLSTFSLNSFLGTALCGPPLQSCHTGGNSLSTGAIVGIAIGSAIGSLSILAILLLLFRLKRRETPQLPVSSSIPPSPEKPPEYDFRYPNPVAVGGHFYGTANGLSATKQITVQTGGNGGLVLFGEEDGGFSLEDLLRASAEVLGKGVVGTTYKAYLENGREAIVKRLKHVTMSEGEFRERVEILGAMAHENLVPLRGYYYGKEEKLLVYEFMPMGSLSSILHGNRGADRYVLTWEVRSSIALQIANGMAYLHSHGPNTVHGNLKSPNVLFPARFRASLSEFGLKGLAVPANTGDLSGYRPPEASTDHWKLSQKSDVYSFGVVLLELLTGRVPADVTATEGVDLPAWARSVVEEKWTLDALDPDLVTRHRDAEDQIVGFLHLAIHCTSRDPDRRPTAAEAAAQIQKICLKNDERES